MRSIIKKLGTLIGARRTLNFIEGSNVTMTIADNPTENRVDITIASAGGSGSPGGSNTQVQFNDGGSFGGDADMTYNKTTNVLSVPNVTTQIIKANSSAGGALQGSSGSDCMEFGAGGGQNVTFLDGVKLDASTASRILSTDASKNITALDTTTYPDLTELSYVKGVTSSIQTQLNSLGGLSQQQVEGLI